MQTNRRRFLGLTLVAAMFWCAPDVAAAEDAAAGGGELARLTLAVPGMT